MIVVEIRPSAPDLRPLSATCSSVCWTVATAHPSWLSPSPCPACAGAACTAPAAPAPGSNESGARAPAYAARMCHGSSMYHAHLATVSVVTALYHDWSRPCQTVLLPPTHPPLGSAYEHRPDPAG